MMAVRHESFSFDPFRDEHRDVAGLIYVLLAWNGWPLYIGQTATNATARMNKAHRGKHWWNGRYVKSAFCIIVPNQAEREDLERQMIKTMKPLYNEVNSGFGSLEAFTPPDFEQWLVKEEVAA